MQEHCKLMKQINVISSQTYLKNFYGSRISMHSQFLPFPLPYQQSKYQATTSHIEKNNHILLQFLVLRQEKCINKVHERSYLVNVYNANFIFKCFQKFYTELINKLYIIIKKWNKW